MRRQWMYLVGVAVVGAVLGVVIAGRPADLNSFRSATSDAAAPVFTTQPPVTTAASSSTAVASQPPVPPAAVTTIAPTTIAPTTVPETTVPETTVPATPPPTTAPPPDTTLPPVNETLARQDVRLVLANGDGRFNLVGRNADRLLALGYTTIDQTDVGARPATTIIYFRQGFEDEAAILAVDLQTPGAAITPLPDTPVTSNDANGDLIVVLGPDAVR